VFDQLVRITATIFKRQNSYSLFVCACINVWTGLYVTCNKVRRFRVQTVEVRSIAVQPISRMPIAGPETALASRIVAAPVVRAVTRKTIRLAGR
jgi:hypothetical protein